MHGPDRTGRWQGSAYRVRNLALVPGSPEDGPLPDAALSWSSDVAGSLGTGSSLVLPAPACGSQTITLAATDSSAAVGRASVPLTRCCFTLSPEGVSYGPLGGNGSLTVAVAGACRWEATSDAAWITITC